MVHKVDTGASVLAWLILALVYFVLTIDALISWDTLTGRSKTEDTLEHCWKQTTRANEISKVAVYLCSPRALTQLSWASLAPSCALPIILCGASLQLTGIYIFQLNSHFVAKARTEYSEGYFRVDPCVKLSLLLHAGFPIFKTCTPRYVMRTL